MNRTFNEFENSQNNNGPISAVDMENIQNNNAVDYIANRNEINIVIDPSPHAINRNLVEVNRASCSNSTNMNATAAPAAAAAASSSANIEVSVPMTMSEYEHIASVSGFEPYYKLNEFNDYHLGESPAASVSLNNYIDLTESDDPKCPEDDDEEDEDDADDDELSNHNDLVGTVATEVICHRAEAKMATCEQISQPKMNSMEIVTSVDDDAISVEEALRALDIAISGGESIFSDYQDDTSSDESDNECQATHLPKEEIEKIDAQSIELIKNVDAKDKISKNEAELDAKNHCDIPIIKHSREYVYDIAKELVDSVLEECTEKISLIPSHSVEDVQVINNNESHALSDMNDVAAESIATTTTITAAAAATDQINRPIQTTDLDDSMDDMFEIGKLQASTPCHKTNVNYQREKNQAGVNLFQTLAEVSENNLTHDGVEPLQESHTQIACATFEVQPIEKQLASTFVKNDDKTFVQNEDKTFVKNDDNTFVACDDKKFVSPDCLHETFNVEINKVKPQIDVPTINPTIKIDKEEVNSDDLTTITPMNTPIELNYVGETWDQFVSKSMNKKPIDLQEKSNEQTSTTQNAVLTVNNAKNPWFLHMPQSDDTFNVNDNDYSNYDGTDEESESMEENAELLSLTFDALRKQLADVLPQATGS